MEIMPILLMLGVLFALARIGNRLFERMGMPGLIGEIMVGIIAANLVILDGETLIELLDITLPDQINGVGPNGRYVVLFALAELGVIFLLFSVGLETKVKELLSVGRTALLVAVLGVAVPFIFGYAYIEFTEGDFHHAMFLAAAMVATSVGITARVIKDMHMMEKRESRIIIGAAIIDDVLGMIVLAIVKGTTGSSSSSLPDIAAIVVEAVAFVLVVIAFAKWGVPRIYEWSEAKKQRVIDRTGKPPQGISLYAFGIVVCLAFAYFAEYIGLAGIIGAFLAGMLFADHAWESGMDKKVEAITSFFISFFFLHVGLQVDIDAIDGGVVVSAVVVIALAVISKYVGCGLGTRLGEREASMDSINIVGCGMVPRGEVGIIVASIGLGIIVEGRYALSPELYTVIVLMAVATTIIAPPLLSRAYREKYPPEYQITSEDKI